MSVKKSKSGNFKNLALQAMVAAEEAGVPLDLDAVAASVGDSAGDDLHERLADGEASVQEAGFAARPVTVAQSTPLVYGHTAVQDDSDISAEALGVMDKNKAPLSYYRELETYHRSKHNYDISTALGETPDLVKVVDEEDQIDLDAPPPPPVIPPPSKLPPW